MGKDKKIGKILVGDFRKFGTNLNRTKIEVMGESEIAIKTYLPIKEKIDLGLKIFTETVILNEGMLTADETIREIATVCYMVEDYTNITLPKDKFEAYDIIKSSGIDKIVEASIGESEIVAINNIVDNYIHNEFEKHEQANSISNVIKNAISGLGTALDGLDVESIKDKITESSDEE